MKIYLGGCKGIKNPTDLNGDVISVGDRLSWDYASRDKEPDNWMLKPIFIVKNHKSGKGLFAEGINKELYLHDFRFEFCEIIKGKNHER